jgi:hypothetical protein
MESFGSTYDAMWSGTGVIIATTLQNAPNFVAHNLSLAYTGNHPFQLDSNSPVIDVGNNAAVPSSIDFDLLRNDRIADWPPEPGSAVDYGAYEFHEVWTPGQP